MEKMGLDKDVMQIHVPPGEARVQTHPAEIEQ